VGRLAEQGEELVADSDDLPLAGGVGEDEVGDAEVLILLQRGGHIGGRTDQPRCRCATAANLAGRGVQARIQDLTAGGQVVRALLPEGVAAYGPSSAAGRRAGHMPPAAG
jgi:hypothetical protein